MKTESVTELDWKILKEKYPNNLDEIKEKLKNNYPIQYIIGNVEFYDSIIEVNEHVLIPRFETEYLVEKIVKRIQKYPENTLNIIDIGTGSGCIAISIAKKLKQNIEGIDISLKALEVAKENAIKNQVNVKFYKLDILNESLEKEYDIIISNPPYVSFEEEVDPKTKYEPQNAIFAKDNGLEFYKRILNIIPNKPKIIAFEIGYKQGKEICELAKNKFPNSKILLEKDLTGKERYVFIEVL